MSVNFEKRISSILEVIRKRDLYPDVVVLDSAATTPEIIVDNNKYLAFCSNNYLSVANDPRVKDASMKGLKEYGVGSGGSRLISGNTGIQGDLERAISNFKCKEDSITFLAGYMANTGTIPALANIYSNLISPKPLEIISHFFSNRGVSIFSDEFNHASIVDGCRLAKAKKIIYKHRNINDLKNKISRDRSKLKIIITDGVFSMDGDIAPLDEIVDVARNSNAILMVDDAHGTGILGENGRGTAEHFHVENEVDVLMGTFTKVFGGVGGFITGSKDLVDYLRITARTYIFSAPIPPSIASGLVESIKIVKNEPARREKLFENILYTRKGIKSLGFEVLGDTQILPLLIHSEEKAISLSRFLWSKKIFAPAVRWPAVKRNEARLRLTLMTDHSKNDIDKLLEALSEAKNKLSI